MPVHLFLKSSTNTDDGTTDEYMCIASLNLVVILLYLAGNEPICISVV